MGVPKPFEKYMNNEKCTQSTRSLCQSLLTQIRRDDSTKVEKKAQAGILVPTHIVF